MSSRIASVDSQSRWLRPIARIIPFLLSICILFGGFSCPSETVRPSVSQEAQRADELVVFFTGSALGSLKPCGCSGGQLGGISKRGAIFKEVPSQGRAIIDVGTLVGDDAEQDLIKFRVFFEAFGLLDYDLVHLTGQDAEIAQNLGLAAAQERSFDVLYAGAPVEGTRWVRHWSKRLVLGRREVVVHVAAFDAQIDSPQQATEHFSKTGDETSVNIVILKNDDKEIRQEWAQVSGIDCIVCASDSDEPLTLNQTASGPLMFTVGRFGRYVGRVRVAFSGPDGDPVLSFETVAVGETLAEDPALVQLYKQYQQIVADSDLLETYPRIPLPDGLAYAGSASCKGCHEAEHAKWSEKAHADALATLVEVGSDRDPECVICHVVGMDREGGFVSAETTPNLKDVGCENCHGPGSKHIRSEGQIPPGEPKMTCLDCHTPEHSSGYAGHEAEYREKIVHWWEP